MLWHTRVEKRMIERYGGRHLVKDGTDGIIRGRPVEVRAIRARDENRFRLQKNVHKELVRKKGSYIFWDKGQHRKVSASQVSKKLGRGKWYKDRTYPHKFLRSEDVF